MRQARSSCVFYRIPPKVIEQSGLVEEGRPARPIQGLRDTARIKEGSFRFRTNYIRLILRYRRESLTDIKKTYPAKTRPTVPSVFRSILNAFIVSPFPLISRLLRCRLFGKGSVREIKAGKILIPSVLDRVLAWYRSGGWNGKKIPIFEPTQSWKIATAAVSLSELFGSRCARSDTLGSDWHGQIEWTT
jgi:hypothetical protein